MSVKVQASGSKSYFFSWWPTKNRKSVKIGNVPARTGLPGMTLAEANERARELSDLWGNGVDPKEYLQRLEADKFAQEEADKRKGSLSQLLEAYTNNMCESGKRTYQQVLVDLVKETKPFFDLDRKATEFTIQHGMSILGAMIKRGAPVQSNRIRSYLMAAFTYGLHHDNDPTKNQSGTLFGLQVNPIQAIPKQKNVEKALDRNLSGKELARLLVDLDNPAYFSKQMSVYFKMMIFTGQRVEEVGRVHWSDIDLQKGLWTMAEARSKVGVSYITPLANELCKSANEAS